MERRDFLLVSLPGILHASRLPRLQGRDAWSEELRAIERRVRGRLGVMALQAGRTDRLAYRERERFPMCSTFKWLLAARVLSRVDAGEETLSRMVSYTAADLLEYAPVARAHVQEGALSVSALCAAAVQESDNTAANLLLRSVGGPAGLTRWLRQTGDQFTRLDRDEPALNASRPGDPRDTTTPDAMAGSLQRIVTGSVLSERSRGQLQAWLVASTTGAARLRAGLPAGWRVGDKTGTGQMGSTNDVAVAWPPQGAPVLMAAYLTRTTASREDREAALAAVGRLVARWVG